MYSRITKHRVSAFANYFVRIANEISIAIDKAFVTENDKENSQYREAQENIAWLNSKWNHRCDNSLDISNGVILDSMYRILLSIRTIKNKSDQSSPTPVSAKRAKMKSSHASHEACKKIWSAMNYKRLVASAESIEACKILVEKDLIHRDLLDVIFQATRCENFSGWLDIFAGLTEMHHGLIIKIMSKLTQDVRVDEKDIDFSQVIGNKEAILSKLGQLSHQVTSDPALNQLPTELQNHIISLLKEAVIVEFLYQASQTNRPLPTMESMWMLIQYIVRLGFLSEARLASCENNLPYSAEYKSYLELCMQAGIGLDDACVVPALLAVTQKLSNKGMLNADLLHVAKAVSVEMQPNAMTALEQLCNDTERANQFSEKYHALPPGDKSRFIIIFTILNDYFPEAYPIWFDSLMQKGAKPIEYSLNWHIYSTMDSFQRVAILQRYIDKLNKSTLLREIFRYTSDKVDCKRLVKVLYQSDDDNAFTFLSHYLNKIHLVASNRNDWFSFMPNGSYPNKFFFLAVDRWSVCKRIYDLVIIHFGDHRCPQGLSYALINKAITTHSELPDKFYQHVDGSLRLLKHYSDKLPHLEPSVLSSYLLSIYESYHPDKTSEENLESFKQLITTNNHPASKPSIRIAPFPAPAPVPERLVRDVRRIDLNTHRQIINRSAAAALKKLNRRYCQYSVLGIADKIEQTYKDMLHQLVYCREFLMERTSRILLASSKDEAAISNYVEQQRNIAAQYTYAMSFIHFAFKASYVDPLTRYPMSHILCLIWSATIDISSEANHSDAPLTEQDKIDRMLHFFNNCYRSMRFYNLLPDGRDIGDMRVTLPSETGEDDTVLKHARTLTPYQRYTKFGPSQLRCGDGNAHEFLNDLSGIHKDVVIINHASAWIQEELKNCFVNVLFNYQVQHGFALDIDAWLKNREMGEDEHHPEIMEAVKKACDNFINQFTPRDASSDSDDLQLLVLTEQDRRAYLAAIECLEFDKNKYQQLVANYHANPTNNASSAPRLHF